MWVVLLEEWSDHEKGLEIYLHPVLAQSLIEKNVAKAIDKPSKDKMVKKATNK